MNADFEAGEAEAVLFGGLGVAGIAAEEVGPEDGVGWFVVAVAEADHALLYGAHGPASVEDDFGIHSVGGELEKAVFFGIDGEGDGIASAFLGLFPRLRRSFIHRLKAVRRKLRRRPRFSSARPKVPSEMTLARKALHIVFGIGGVATPTA